MSAKQTSDGILVVATRLVAQVLLAALPSELAFALEPKSIVEVGLEVPTQKSDRITSAVYMPSAAQRPGVGPALDEARVVIDALIQRGARKLVVVSSAEIYGASPRNAGFLDETRVNAVRAQRKPISAAWLAFEALAQKLAAEHPHVTLTLLRPCAMPMRGGDDYFSTLLSSRIAITLAGHDPSLQWLAPADLAHAVQRALAHDGGGVFNIAPDGVVPIHAALARCHAQALAVPRVAQQHARALLSPSGLAEPLERLDYLRFSWTVSARKSKQVLGFAPTRNSVQALQEFLGDSAAPSTESFDDFGMDKAFVETRGRGLFDFLARYYWRIEVQGLEHVPSSGKGILAGMHRGLVAWDGVMIMHLLAQRMNRYPRFLVHPTGFQFPFIFDFTTKLGGLVACLENADYVLEHDELLGIFPEGLRGVFTLYREAYRLRKFGRHDFVKIALRHGAPIIPFVIIGSAETYPIVAKVDWPWWSRKTEWPYFPITPMLFPLVPALPLPVKWQICFLPPIDVSGYSPEDAKDTALVRKISDDVKRRMEEAIEDTVSRRRSMFFG